MQTILLHDEQSIVTYFGNDVGLDVYRGGVTFKMADVCGVYDGATYANIAFQKLRAMERSCLRESGSVFCCRFRRDFETSRWFV